MRKKLRKYLSSDCARLVDLFYTTVHSVNARDYTSAQLDTWASKEISLKDWDNAFLNSHTIVIDDKADTILGFGNIYSDGHLDKLYVNKNYQSVGIGALILEEAENFAKKNGVGVITVDASITAKPFFEKHGYKTIAKQYNKRGDEILINFLMKKPIK